MTLREQAARVGNQLRELFDLRDLFWIAGLVAVGFGLAQMYPPAAWVVCGTALFWMGIRR